MVVVVYIYHILSWVLINLNYILYQLGQDYFSLHWDERRMNIWEISLDVSFEAWNYSNFVTWEVSTEASYCLLVVSLVKPISWRTKPGKTSRGNDRLHVGIQYRINLKSRGQTKEMTLEMSRFYIPADHLLQKPFPLGITLNKSMRIKILQKYLKDFWKEHQSK